MYKKGGEKDNAEKNTEADRYRKKGEERVGGQFPIMGLTKTWRQYSPGDCDYRKGKKYNSAPRPNAIAQAAPRINSL